MKSFIREHVAEDSKEIGDNLKDYILTVIYEKKFRLVYEYFNEDKILKDHVYKVMKRTAKFDNN